MTGLHTLYSVVSEPSVYAPHRDNSPLCAPYVVSIARCVRSMWCFMQRVLSLHVHICHLRTLYVVTIVLWLRISAVDHPA